jgi:hypothetical protein
MRSDIEKLRFESDLRAAIEKIEFLETDLIKANSVEIQWGEKEAANRPERCPKRKKEKRSRPWNWNELGKLSMEEI